MSFRHLRTSVFIVTVLSLSLGMAQWSIANDSASSATTASSGGCVPPAIAVDLYLGGAGDPGFAFNASPSTVEACETVCDAFRSTCRSIAQQSRSCGNTGGAQWTSLRRAACSTLETKDDRNDCRDATNAEQRFINDCRNDDRRHAQDCCDTFAADVCMADCLDDPFDVPQCFTGPGGIGEGSCFFNLLNSTL